MATTTILVHAIVTEPGFATQTEVEAMLAQASTIYASAGLSFQLDSFEVDATPELQLDEGPLVATGPGPLYFELAREAKSCLHEGRIVVYLRRVDPTNLTAFKGGSYSSGTSNHVVLGAVSGTDFGHEVGHFFHLEGHTHHDVHTEAIYQAGKDYGYAAAEQKAIDIIKAEGGIHAFDGDAPRVGDTPPDPGPPLFQTGGWDVNGDANIPGEECGGTGTITLNVDGTNYVLAPDRHNIMSYFKHCNISHSITPDQQRIVKEALLTGNRRHLVGAGFAEGPSALVTAQGHIHVFARADDFNVWRNVWNGSSWSGWRDQLGPGVLTSGPASVSTPGGHLHVFARGRDENIWHTFFDGSPQWSSWRDDLGGGQLTSAPAAVVSGSDIHVFARGKDRAIWHTFWDGSAWSGWRSDLPSGTFTSGPTALLSGDGAIHVLAKGDDHDVWHAFWKHGVWTGWSSELGEGRLTSPPVAVSTGPHLHVLGRGADRQMWHTFWNGSTWSGWRQDLPAGTLLSGPGATVTPDGAIHVFAVGDDRTVLRCRGTGSGWSPWLTDMGNGTFQP